MIFHSPYQPTGTGTIRNCPEDFIVNEIPSFIPSGEGEHLWLHIRKIHSNTDWVAGQLAKLFQVKKHDVGFAGLKDRHAVTTQWFSVYLPGKEAPDLRGMLTEILADSIDILKQTRHLKKLRRGTLKGNQFTIIVRDFSGDKSRLEHTIENIRSRGLPNYYGVQRFGHTTSDGAYGNIEKATAWFKGEMKKPKNRNQRSLYLSASRSWIFNHILSERVKNGTWDKPVSGDIFMLDGSHSWFLDDADESIPPRLEQLDIHPSGALWGRGRLASAHETEALEVDIAAQFSVLCQGLEMNGLNQERRALRIKVGDLAHQWLDATSLEFRFSLPPGSYATVLLDQLCTLGGRD